MANLTSRERLLLTLDHQEPDRVPLHYRGSEPGLRRLIDEAGLDEGVRTRFLEGDVDVVAFHAPGGDPAYDSYHRTTPIEATIDYWGIGHLRHSDSGEYLMTEQIYHPLSNAATPGDIERYPWPDVTQTGGWAHIDDVVKQSHNRNRPVIGQMSQTIAETAYGLRPMSQLFVDLFENPELVRALFERLCEARCFQARTFAQAGVDVLRIGDDLATQETTILSPETYQEWVKPYHARVVEAAREIRPDLPVLYHSDGNIEGMIPDLLEIGVTAINPVQPECMPPAEVKQRWGDRLTFWGAAGTQRHLAFGTEQDAWEEVAKRMEAVAPGGGYVASFINVAWSPTARRNVFAYLQAVQELGTYP